MNNEELQDWLGYVLVSSSGQMLEGVVYPTLSKAEDMCHLGTRIAKYIK